MDLYYTRKLLAVAHNRVDNFVALRFQLSGWKIRSIDNIKIISHESMIYEHQSSKNPDLWYLVDMRLGICECNLTGAPCKHQTSIAIHYRICGLNQLPTMSADSRHNYVYLALGEKRKELSFYADLHQAQIDKESMHTTVEPTILTSNNSFKNNFNNIHPGSSAIDSSQFLNNEDINSNSGDESSNEMDDSDDNSETDENLHQLTINELRWFCNDIENLIGEDDPTLHKSVRKFIKAYKKRRLMQDIHVRPAITSFFQTCEWNAKRANNNGYQRGGKRIKVQVASVARRKGTLSKGRRKMRQGKPRKNSQDISTQETKGPTILLSLHGQENTKQNVLMI